MQHLGDRLVDRDELPARYGQIRVRGVQGRAGANRETLEVLYKGKSIADVLDMSVEEAIKRLEHPPPIRSTRDALPG